MMVVCACLGRYLAKKEEIMMWYYDGYVPHYYGYGYGGRFGYSFSFTLIVVLFILLIIVLAAVR
jgi:uncharacterized protein (TIGR01732 family)